MSKYKKPLTPEEIANIRDEDIDFSDIPETDAAFWADAELVMPENKKSVHLRVDPDVLEWFKAQGKGHLTRMNAVLRSYYEAHKKTGPAYKQQDNPSGAPGFKDSAKQAGLKKPKKKNKR